MEPTHSDGKNEQGPEDQGGARSVISNPEPSDCSMCAEATSSDRFLWSTDLFNVLLHKNQSRTGRCLIVPKAHADLMGVYTGDDPEQSLMMGTIYLEVKTIVRILSLLYDLPAFHAIQTSNCRHLYVDVIPRYAPGRDSVAPYEYARIREDMVNMYLLLKDQETAHSWYDTEYRNILSEHPIARG
jgi:diadenosine tetraphosphate (Ap4A) HIT family hydrolase